jgi:exopolyphosphatase/guanosine-5'-triphosphate,3'-diphosphate pyrophosphatase
VRIAALDVGSNSFHVLIVQVQSDGRVEVLARAKEMVRLGETSLRTGVIPPEVFRRGLEALASLRRLVDRYRPDALVAIATSAVREAQNGGEFVRAARDELGIDIQVIRGQEEGRLIYLGARGTLNLDGRRVALFDLGGGSLEVILADARECYFIDSLKLGVIRLSEEWGASDPPSARELAGLRASIRQSLAPVIGRITAMGFDFVALSSGTASALAALNGALGGAGGGAGGGGGGGGNGGSGSGRGDGTPTVLTQEALIELEQKLGRMTLEERARLPGLDARRADTILPGAMVLRAALELSGATEATLAEGAVREGIVADYIATHRPGILMAEEFPDLRRRSVMALARRCQFDEAHAQQVARLALSLFDQTRALHNLPESDGELLEFSALLHDVGMYISPDKHHQHSQYLIETNEMAGFSRDEVEIMALTARYHRKAEPPGERERKSAPRRHERFCALSRGARERVRFLTAFLRIADALDRTHSRLVRAIRCQVHRKTIELRIEVDGDPELELWATRRKGDLLESISGLRLRLSVDSVAEPRHAVPGMKPGTEPDGHLRSSAKMSAASPAPTPATSAVGAPRTLPRALRKAPLKTARASSRLARREADA